jgi:hypothetical protein
MIECHYENERIRDIHGFGRSCTFRSSLRNTEARRGTSQGRCKESSSTRIKVEALLLFPRFSRKGLVNRFSHLAGGLRITRPFIDNLRNRNVKTVGIIHWIIFGRTIAEPEGLVV